jgi:hypothetical protein
MLFWVVMPCGLAGTDKVRLKSAGSAVDMKSYPCGHPCNTIRIHNALHRWRLLEFAVFGMTVGEVRVRKKKT